MKSQTVYLKFASHIEERAFTPVDAVPDAEAFAAQFGAEVSNRTDYLAHENERKQIAVRREHGKLMAAKVAAERP